MRADLPFFGFLIPVEGIDILVGDQPKLPQFTQWGRCLAGFNARQLILVWGGS